LSPGRLFLEFEVHKHSPGVFVVFLNAVIQRFDMRLVEEAQHLLFQNPTQNGTHNPQRMAAT
jgi:hypothetical protein